MEEGDRSGGEKYVEETGYSVECMYEEGVNPVSRVKYELVFNNISMNQRPIRDRDEQSRGTGDGLK